jgi:hypothetical protein
MSEPQATLADGRGVRQVDPEVVELLLLLPAEEAHTLEEAARQRDLTAGQLLRRLIRDFLDPGLPRRRGGKE